VAAPGVNILSTLPNSAVFLDTHHRYYQNYDSLDGTSMAAPHAFGWIDLVHGQVQHGFLRAEPH
jgi:subtilisin family serine protease